MLEYRVIKENTYKQDSKKFRSKEIARFKFLNVAEMFIDDVKCLLKENEYYYIQCKDTTDKEWKFIKEVKYDAN